MEVLSILLLMLAGHFVGDFVLQPAPMSSGKNRNNSRERFDDGFPQWYYWLSAHASTHGLIVYLVTGSIIFMLLEFISHWLIDLLKCDKKISLHQDQSLHILSKILYIVIIVFYGIPA
ncbi:MAG: hypothetical protein CMP91_02730 [Gammaproteobacteria bacterium]|nr:hypothetical protein [Gammaproteobacteria bacterium]MAY02422.1 hypothetical protein [Gammaproteobacteria bacterium]|tara:strand:+ start:475 stop:828 length:354 start_codon:yes stop_codon:yes gene_type:complete